MKGGQKEGRTGVTPPIKGDPLLPTSTGEVEEEEVEADSMTGDDVKNQVFLFFIWYCCDSLMCCGITFMLDLLSYSD